ncbi:hypothetical protein HK104_002492 [Borealophlyctis nickersoniae]|nr:hypothetical protein HK104_002492 [Borealophlyctis nickersoniae]
MGKTSYRTRKLVCGILFWTKAFISLLISFAGLGLMSLRIYELHRDAMTVSDFNQWRNKPVTIDPASASCAATQSGRARLEPSSGILYLVSLLGPICLEVSSFAWENAGNAKYVRKMNALNTQQYSNAFLQVTSDPTSPYNRAMLDWHAQSVQQHGGTLAVTMEVVVPLTELTDAIYDMIAQHLRDINSKQGVPVFLRWCHEMNGDWTGYGYKPLLYIPSFQKMSLAVKKYTNMTAMLWSPNLGIAYPFTPTPDSLSPPPTRTSDPANFALLKTSTNNPNVLDWYDDPYTPYYPGDQYVDWVGLSVYLYPDDPNTNTPTLKDYFADVITGTGQWVDRVMGPDSNPQTRAVRDFYTRFAVNRNKPFALSESGAPWLVNKPGTSELDIKRAWWEQLFNSTVYSQFPMLKMVVNFEERKDNGDGMLQDWALTVNPVVAAPYQQYLMSQANALLMGDKMTFGCDGSLQSTK